ncbi:unnamed protein product [Calypogeia fissa]
MAAGVSRNLACVPLFDERGNLQPNCHSRHEEARRKKTVCLGGSRDFFGNTSQVENCEVLISPLKKSVHRYQTVSGRHGGSCRRSFTQQDVIYKSAHFVHETPCHFMADRTLKRASSTICRVHSAEGTEKSYGADKNLEQKKVEVLKVPLQANGEILKVDKQESERFDPSAGGNGKQVNSVNSAELDGKEHAERPRNGSSSVVLEESREGSSEVETKEVPPEELKDYGTGGDWEEEIEYVTRISVPRQRYIPVPKVDLVNALLLLFFPANKDASRFLSICSYMEMTLHAEHKILLEELRSDYSLTHSVQEDNRVPTAKGATNSTKLGTVSTERAQKHELVGEQSDWPVDLLDMDGGENQNPLKVLTDLRTKFMSAVKRKRSKYFDIDDGIEEESSNPTSDVEVSHAAAERFQKNFVKILRRAEFKGISLRDLELTASLNSDYLLSTPVDVDWKRTSSSNVKIFRRGYTKEEQKGLLLGEKFDYLQSVALRLVFKGFTGPLLNAGRWCIQNWRSLWNDKESRELAESVSGWLQEPLQLENEEPVNASEKSTHQKAIKHNREAQLDMPIWLAGRTAIPRYEAILSSAGSRGLLIRRILVRMRLVQMETPSQTLPVADESVLEPHLRPSHLSRVSMKDIWLPASKAGKNVLKRISAAFSVFFSRATLQEPAFKELVLLYNTDDGGDSMETGLQLQTYNRIPLPDLKIVFPSKKLRFRVLDTLRLDITSIAGVLAFLVNYRFDDFLSSPSAFVLDIIAASALVVLATRVGFGYKTVWDRYQLLVNKTLYEKTGAQGFGVVQFLLDESEEQQFKEAILVFTILVHQGKTEGMTTKQLADSCERFLYYRCKEQVEMPVHSAVRTLLRFGLIVRVNETLESNSDEGEVRFRALSYEEGLKVLEQHWVSMPSITALWN